MLDEAISALNLTKGKTVVDATTGGAGHSRRIAKLIAGGTLVCLDKDKAAIEHSQTIVKDAKFVHSDFVEIAKVLDNLGIKQVDAILADLGVSSYQIDTPERGFSYMNNAPLDMRMNRDSDLTAEKVVNIYPAERLLVIIRDLGEERYARRITDAIIKARPIKTTLELAEVCKSAVPGNYYKTGGHPAKRTFQAIRIHVNSELDVIEKFIKSGTGKLRKGGRIAIISFHSLEDRIVKQTFKTLSTDCLCPPRSPMCICGHKATLRVLTKKPIEPGELEIKNNPRSHSAKLRVAERI